MRSTRFDPHAKTPHGDVRGMGTPIEHLVLMVCRSAAGVWRSRHEYDKDGNCVFCPSRVES